MRRFRFQFEALATVRKRAEEHALKSLAEAQRGFHEAVAHRRALEGALAISLARREELGRTPVFPVDFGLETDFITGTKQRMIQADQGIMRAQRSVEKALRAYLIARRQTRTIELLREKAYAEFRRARAKHEQKELDDLYLMRARMPKLMAHQEDAG